MKPLLLRSLFLAAAVVSSAAFARAADEAKKDSPDSKSHEISAKTIGFDPAPPVLISIDFRGGSLRDFTTQISKIKDVSLNIIGATPELDEVALLPAFTLRNAPLMTVVHVVRHLLEPHNVRLDIAGAEQNSAVMIASHRPPAKAHPPQLQIQTESFQLEKYLLAQSVDDIVGAIRAAWELNPANPPDVLKLKYHPGTTILIVSGPPHASNTAAKIIASLKIPPEKSPLK